MENSTLGEISAASWTFSLTLRHNLYLEGTGRIPLSLGGRGIEIRRSRCHSCTFRRENDTFSSPLPQAGDTTPRQIKQDMRGWIRNVRAQCVCFVAAVASPLWSLALRILRPITMSRPTSGISTLCLGRRIDRWSEKLYYLLSRSTLITLHHNGHRLGVSYRLT